jgi:hypothetical protein
MNEDVFLIKTLWSNLGSSLKVNIYSRGLRLRYKIRYYG